MAELAAWASNISITTDSGKEKEKFPEKEDVLKVIQAKLEQSQNYSAKKPIAVYDDWNQTRSVWGSSLMLTVQRI